jgi:hypothetical protein
VLHIGKLIFPTASSAVHPLNICAALVHTGILNAGAYIKDVQLENIVAPDEHADRLNNGTVTNAMQL